MLIVTMGMSWSRSISKSGTILIFKIFLVFTISFCKIKDLFHIYLTKLVYFNFIKIRKKFQIKWPCSFWRYWGFRLELHPSCTDRTGSRNPNWTPPSGKKKESPFWIRAWAALGVKFYSLTLSTIQLWSSELKLTVL